MAAVRCGERASSCAPARGIRPCRCDARVSAQLRRPKPRRPKTPASAQFVPLLAQVRCGLAKVPRCPPSCCCRCCCRCCCCRCCRCCSGRCSAETGVEDEPLRRRRFHCAAKDVLARKRTWFFFTLALLKSTCTASTATANNTCTAAFCCYRPMEPHGMNRAFEHVKTSWAS